MFEHSDHHRITAAGWAYRTNSRGRISYRDPQTRLWQTHSQAISIIHAQVSNSNNGGGQPSPEISPRRFAEK